MHIIPSDPKERVSESDTLTCLCTRESFVSLVCLFVFSSFLTPPLADLIGLSASLREGRMGLSNSYVSWDGWFVLTVKFQIRLHVIWLSF